MWRISSFAILLVVMRYAHAEPVRFEIDVMSVLSKAGCNMGTCHGNQNGKGGFKLSLRGQDPREDFESIVKQFRGRRIDRLSPQQSLLLRKPLAQLPHQGGRRFRLKSQEFEILYSWISQGATGPSATTPTLKRLDVSPTQIVLVDPQKQTQLTATAVFSDGTMRDVSSLAVYETSDSIASVSDDGLARRQAFGETTVIVRYLQKQVPVRLSFVPARPGFRWSNPPADNYIDRHIYTRLRSLRINPSELADDRTFARRAFLDTLGILPTIAQTWSVSSDQRPDGRDRTVDMLLARPEFADRWALHWSDLLRNEEKVLDVKGVEVYYQWIRDCMATGKPIDQFVREIIAARGSTYENPPTNFWRACRDPFSRSETTARLFLGTRLQCARCHNHPFERWTQDDYYSWAAMFARIDYEIKENKRRDKNDKNEFVGEQIVKIMDEGEVRNARTGEDAAPRFLGTASPLSKPNTERLVRLSHWLTSSGNHLFLRSQANLIWYHTMGRGLVEPLDDFRATNPPVNPPLLDSLAREFAERHFDLRHLVRRILTSRTYQLSAEPNETNQDDQTNFSRAIVRRLSAEQLLDAQSQVIGLPAKFAGYDPPIRAGQLPGIRRVRLRDEVPAFGDRFLRTFGKSQRLMACECERSDDTNIKQVFELLCGPSLGERLPQPGSRLEELAKSKRPRQELIDEVFQTALTRRPTDRERSAAHSHFENINDRFVAIQDIAWALMNAKEFNFRR